MSSLDKPTVIPPFAPDANSGAIDIEIRVFKRKRVRITAVGFLVALALSLSVNYLRPAVYRATALLEIEPPTAQTGTPMVILLGKERERLMSESIARELDDRLYGGLGGGAGTPLTPGIDGTLSAEIAPNTHIVKLSAEGGDPSILPVIVNTWSEVYQARLSATQRDSTEETRSTLEAQFVEFEARVAEKRNEIGAFRRKHDIVSDDMARNRAPARFQEVSEALAKAREDQIVAAAELNSFRQAAAEGKPVSTERDKRVIADLEARVQNLRGRIRDFEERFTSAYETYDPSIKAARKQLEDVETTLRAKRGDARAAVITEAEQTLNSAQVRVQALEAQYAEHQSHATAFMEFNGEHKALRGELSDLEQQRQAVQVRIVETEVTNRNLFPRIKVLERAFAPSIPVRPDYSRDAMYGLAGSTLFGLLLYWFYSKLNDPRRYVASHSSQQPNIYSYHTELITPAAALPANQAPPATNALEHRGQRELSLVEVEALWAASAPEDRLLIALLLSGMTFDEIANLKPDAVDGDRGLIDVKVDHVRSLPIAPKLAELVGYFEADPGLFSGTHAIVARIAQLPYSAGLADPASVDARALRHTYICFLVRQGVKFDALQRIVGGLDPHEMQQYSDMMPPMPGKQLEDVMLVYPALETKLLPR